MEQPPNSPDLTLCDFWLFPCLKSTLRQSRFDINEAVVAAANSRFNSINSNEFAKTWVSGGRDGTNASHYGIVILEESV